MDNSRVKATIFFIEKISFSLKLYSGHFYGQSFIKTVRGPLVFFLSVHLSQVSLYFRTYEPYLGKFNKFLSSRQLCGITLIQMNKALIVKCEYPMA